MFLVPKVRMAGVLLVLSLLAIERFFSIDLIFRFIFILAATLALEYLFWKIRKVPPFLPSAGVVSVLIIFLLADPGAKLELTLLAILQLFLLNNS